MTRIVGLYVWLATRNAQRNVAMVGFPRTLGEVMVGSRYSKAAVSTAIAEMRPRHLLGVLLALFACMILISLRTPSVGRKTFDLNAALRTRSEAGGVDGDSPAAAAPSQESVLEEAERLLARLRELKTENDAMSQVVDRPPSRNINAFEPAARDESLARLLDSVVANANALQAEKVPDTVVVVERPVPASGRPVSAAAASSGDAAGNPILGHLQPAKVESFPASYGEGVPGDAVGRNQGAAVVEWGSQFSAPVNADKSNPFQTTYKCYRSVDWAEICIYKNLCHDGNMIVFFDDTKGDNKTLIPRYTRRLL